MSTTKDEDARAKVVSRTARSGWLVGLEEGNIRFQLLLRVVSSTHHETKSYVLALPCCAVCCLIFFVSFVRGYYAEGSPSATAPCRILVPSYLVPSISMLGGLWWMMTMLTDDDLGLTSQQRVPCYICCICLLSSFSQQSGNVFVLHQHYQTVVVHWTRRNSR